MTQNPAASPLASLDANRSSASPEGPAKPEGHGPPAEKLHLFINRMKYTADDGVTPVMTGRQLAALAEVPSDVAVIRRGNNADAPTVGLEDELTLRQAEHFTITRRVVEGGHGD